MFKQLYNYSDWCSSSPNLLTAFFLCDSKYNKIIYFFSASSAYIHIYHLHLRHRNKVELQKSFSAMAAATSFVLLFILTCWISPSGTALSTTYYDQTCPKAESIIRKAVKKSMVNDITVPAALLRMHFHDCFIRVCQSFLCSLFYLCMYMILIYIYIYV